MSEWILRTATKLIHVAETIKWLPLRVRVRVGWELTGMGYKGKSLGDEKDI